MPAKANLRSILNALSLSLRNSQEWMSTRQSNVALICQESGGKTLVQRLWCADGFGQTDTGIGFIERISPESRILFCQNIVQQYLFMDVSGTGMVAKQQQHQAPTWNSG